MVSRLKDFVIVNFVIEQGGILNRYTNVNISDFDKVFNGIFSKLIHFLSSKFSILTIESIYLWK